MTMVEDIKEIKPPGELSSKTRSHGVHAEGVYVRTMKPDAKIDRQTEYVIPTKIYILIGLGFILLVLPIVSLLVDSQLVFIKYVTRIENGSDIYHMLLQEIPGAFVHIYIFNVTNGEAFASGEDDRLKVEEVGPFIYQEYRINGNFELDEEAGVMRYTPQLRTKFIPEGSIGDPHKINVTVANSVFLAMASMLSNHPFWTKTLYNVLVNRVRSTVLTNVDVHSLLWGYEEPFITVGNTIFPGWITFSKMGYLDRLFDQKAIPRIELGISGMDKFKIKSLNGARGLNVWEYENPSKRTRCNTLEDTYEGIAYPPGLSPETKLRLYRNVFCRMLDLDFVGTRTIDYGPEAFIYKIKNDTFNIGPSSECLCYKRRCKNGVSDLSPCLYDLPLVLSHGHFLHSDPELYERIEGIHPDETKHGSEIVVDPKIGLVLKTFFTVQLNIDVQDVSYNRAAKPFTNMVVPLAYFTIIQADIPEDAKEKIRGLHYNVFYMIHGAEICMFILSLVVLLYTARNIYWSMICSKRLGYQISKKKKKPINFLQTEQPLMQEKEIGLTKVIESERLREREDYSL